MMIRYVRHGGRKPPRDRELLEISDEGAFTMWRSVGSATYPPTPVGRFAGQLDPDTFAQLKAEINDALAIGDLELVPKPDAAIETVTVNTAKARMGTHDEPDGPWGVLMERLRQLLHDLTSMPTAAIDLEVPSDGSVAKLVHLGSEPLPLDLTDLSVRAVMWQGYHKSGDWWAPDASKPPVTSITAMPGWTMELPFDHGFQATQEQEVVAHVTLAAFEGESKVPVALNTSRKNV